MNPGYLTKIEDRVKLNSQPKINQYNNEEYRSQLQGMELLMIRLRSLLLIGWDQQKTKGQATSGLERADIQKSPLKQYTRGKERKR